MKPSFVDGFTLKIFVKHGEVERGDKGKVIEIDECAEGQTYTRTVSDKGDDDKSTNNNNNINNQNVYPKQRNFSKKVNKRNCVCIYAKRCQVSSQVHVQQGYYAKSM